MAEKLYKVLAADGSCCNGGSGKWNLPHDGQPGEWMPPIKEALVACENGYHLCRFGDLLSWLNETLYESEYRGKRVEPDNKVVVREARLLRRVKMWNERTARLFAADCAEHVLPIFEKVYPNDNRPRKAIEAARAYVRGEINEVQLADTAAAVWDVARAAARAAAWDAARAAAWDAARAAARAVAWDAEAARATARAAVWAAWDAAGDAAGAAEAAEAAERVWQTNRLREYLKNESKTVKQ